MSDLYDLGDQVIVCGDDFFVRGEIAAIYSEGDFDVRYRVGADYDYYEDLTADPDLHVVSKVEPEPPTLKHGDILTSGDENRVVIGDRAYHKSGGSFHVSLVQKLVNAGDGYLRVIGNVFDLADTQ